MKLERLKHQFSRFKDNEDGAIMPYIIVTFMLMVVATGMAIDLMRHEIARADVQNALDRAVLAAASRTQTKDREDVFNSYMETRTFHELDEVKIDHFDAVETERLSEVSAKAHYDVPTWFMKLIGVTELAAPAAATAKEGIGEVEIVVVMDTSFSMSFLAADGNTRMWHLKNAARAFINSVLETEDQASYTTISLVTFSTNVGLQRTMADAFRPSIGGKSNMCFDFNHDDYGVLELKEDQAYPYRGSGCNSFGQDNLILPFTNNKQGLLDYIDDMDIESSTYQHLGIKWGAGMLDPSFRDIMQTMTSSVVNEHGSGGPIARNDYWNGTGLGDIRGLPVDEDGNLDVSRAKSIPRDFGHNGVQKILIHMADGAAKRGPIIADTPLINQRAEYQCDLLHGRTFDTDLFEDTYDDTEDHIRNIPHLSGDLFGKANPTPAGVTVYTVALFPPIGELMPRGAEILPDEIRAKTPTMWRKGRDPVTGGYVWRHAADDGTGLSSYDYENWQDREGDIYNPGFTAADHEEIRNRITPLYNQMRTLLSDDEEEGCASIGRNYEANDASDFVEIFSNIAADVSRLKLVN